MKKLLDTWKADDFIFSSYYIRYFTHGSTFLTLGICYIPINLVIFSQHTTFLKKSIKKHITTGAIIGIPDYGSW